VPTSKPKAQPPAIEAEDESSDSIIHSFGMYWQRDLVVWRNDLKMYGKQQALSKPVDFGKQKGIYILYDHHTVVYVGRAIDRPLGKRLYEHTVDRLGSRWNRFSWFGLLDVTQEGNLRETPFNSSLAAVVATLEALLMTAGVAIFGTFTASVASFFLEEEQEQDEQRDNAILAEIGITNTRDF
jgi:hypothetical protein